MTNMLKVSVTDMNGTVLELLVVADNPSRIPLTENEFARKIRERLDTQFNVCDDNPEDIAEMKELLYDEASFRNCP